MALKTILVFVAVSFTMLAGQALATSQTYGEITAMSANKRYRVEAKSPDNARGWPDAIQSNFTFTCFDTTTQKVIWTRKQPNQESAAVAAKASKARVVHREAPPVDVFVSDAGWTVIRTGTDELIAVDPSGKEPWKIELLKKAFTKDEHEKYVHNTSMGPMWAGCSLWYFLENDAKRLFVIRPWWGRRIILDVGNGKPVAATEEVAKRAADYERDYVLGELRKAVATRKDWEGHESSEPIWPFLTATYLAGKISVKEAVPLLRQLEDSAYCDVFVYSSTDYKPRDGGLDPSTWNEMTVRRVVHLSLRRLGEAPSQYPCTQFDRSAQEPGAKEQPFDKRGDKQSRTERVGAVKQGMKPEDVLARIGAPDFIDLDTWCYDIDAQPPFTLTVSWSKQGVYEVQQHRPPFWKSEKWDEAIAY